MALIPENYLYLVDIESERVLAVFPIDHLSRELEVISLESRLRIDHGVDDPETGLALRDSRVRPLEFETLRKALSRR